MSAEDYTPPRRRPKGREGLAATAGQRLFQALAALRRHYFGRPAYPATASGTRYIVIATLRTPSGVANG